MKYVSEKYEAQLQSWQIHYARLNASATWPSKIPWSLNRYSHTDYS
jgi:hypothetical protein